MEPTLACGWQYGNGNGGQVPCVVLPHFCDNYVEQPMNVLVESTHEACSRDLQKCSLTLGLPWRIGWEWRAHTHTVSPAISGHPWITVRGIYWPSRALRTPSEDLISIYWISSWDIKNSRKWTLKLCDQPFFLTCMRSQNSESPLRNQTIFAREVELGRLLAFSIDVCINKTMC